MARAGCPTAAIGWQAGGMGSEAISARVRRKEQTDTYSRRPYTP